MKAFEVRKDGKLIDVIVELSLDQAIKVANQKHPYTTDDDLMEVIESPCTIGRDIDYSTELEMFMIKLSDGVYHPLIEWVCTKPLDISGKHDPKLCRVNCNRINDDLYRR